ncbi:MAG: DNA ligase (NAD(+)) LigA, partial [Spirochaetota bacterium]
MEAKRIVSLEAEIRRHQALYYNGEPEIEDADFDSLWDELRSLDPGNSLFSEVGRDLADGWPKASHLIPMGSQDKAANPEDFLSWCAKVAHSEYFVQYKLDGASLELQYRSGSLVRAVTRGDGLVGDDISPNARRMNGVIASLSEPFTGGIRGEVLMTHEIQQRSYSDKANCRNAANGLMKRKDGRGSEDLLVVVYDALASGSSPFSDEMEKITWLSRIGFHTVEARTFTKAEEVVAYRARVMAERASLPFDIDGLVVKGRVIDLEDLRRARPEKQIAFKFSLEEAISTLIDVEWSESGATFTPIGIIEPVRLAGTTVQRANLCNTNTINDLGLR